MAENRETRSREHTRSYRGSTPSKASYPAGEERGSSALARRETTSPGSYGITSPFSMMRRLVEDMDRMFTDYSGTSALAGSHLWSDTGRSIWTPQIETFRRGDKLVVRADLPGLDKDNVNVELDENVLTISGERQDEHEEERDDYYRSERSYGRFYRAIALPDNVEEDKIDAKFKDGVLEVTIPAPKEEASERRRIDVK